MLKIKLSIFFCFLLSFCFAQRELALKYETRLHTYLTFKGSLSPFIKITETDARVYKSNQDKLNDNPEFIIAYDEIKTFEQLVKNAPNDSIEAILKRKGKTKWSKKTKSEIQILYENEDRDASENKPLSGKRILIDPGHIAGNFEMSVIEQKYLRFVKDSVPNLPVDSIHISEGILTFATAQILKKQLEEQGALVWLTRDDNKTSFGITYQEWLSTRKQIVLDSLLECGAMEKTKYNKLKKEDEKTFFWSFFRDHELANRVKVINKNKPDLTIIIHYNVDEKNTDWVRPTEKNFCMAFVPGGMNTDALKGINGKANVLRLLLTDDFPLSEKISDLTVKEFSKQLGNQVAKKTDADYLKDNCISSSKQGVFCRNLALCRLVKSPLVYGECLYQDNKNEYLELSKADKTYYGINTNTRVKVVSDAYFNAIMQFYKK